MDSILRSLLEEADEARWKMLLLAADRALDLGDESLALGYRWIVEEKKWPMKFLRGFGWFSHPNLIGLMNGHDMIPHLAFDRGQEVGDGTRWHGFESVSEALHALAVQMGRKLFSEWEKNVGHRVLDMIKAERKAWGIGLKEAAGLVAKKHPELVEYSPFLQRHQYFPVSVELVRTIKEV